MLKKFSAPFLTLSDQLFGSAKELDRLTRRDYAILGGVTSLIFFLFFLRRQDALTNPQFWAEDALIYFRDNLNLGLGAFGKLYSGSPYTLQRLVALLATPFGVVNAPLIYNLVALVLGSLGLAFFSLPYFRHIIRNDYLRIFFCLVCALLPEMWEIVGVITNVHWLLAIWLVFVGLLPLPRTKWGFGLLLAVLVIVTFSCPQAILLLPIWFIRLGRGFLRRQTGELILSGVMLVSLILSVVFVLVDKSGASYDPTTGEKASFNPMAALNLAVGRVITQAMRGGSGLASVLQRHEFVLTTLIFLFLVGVLIWMTLGKNLPFVLYGFYLIFGSLLLLLVGRPDWNSSGARLPGIPILEGSRYFVLGLAMVYFIFLVSLDKLPEDHLIKTGLMIVSTVLILGVLVGVFTIQPFKDFEWRPQATKLQTMLDEGKPFSTTIPINPNWAMLIERK